MKANSTAGKSELDIKLDRIRELLVQFKLDALLLQQTSNFAWATCGASAYVNRADLYGSSALLVTPTNRYVLTDNIEAPRLMAEEELIHQGWELKVCAWHERSGVTAGLAGGMQLGADTYMAGAVDLSAEISWLRAQLTPQEGERFRQLGRLCGSAMQAAVQAVRPGMTEFEIAGLLAQAAEARGVQVIVNLIGTDERVFLFRHPLPTSKRLERYAMLVLCGRKGGLICSLTRLVHFGASGDDLRRRENAVARIDAVLIAATRPGRCLGDIFREAQDAYAAAGFPDEWRDHHQGGSAGYAPREITATPASTRPVLLGQAFAWNPSIRGSKSEDTILVGEASNEILTGIDSWPMIDVPLGGAIIQRPAILVRD